MATVGVFFLPMRLRSQRLIQKLNGRVGLRPRLRDAAGFGRYELVCADALSWLADAPRDSIHAVVTDPPYGLVEYQPNELAKLKNGRGGSHTFLTHEFVAALVENREPAINVYEALAMTAPGIVAYQSALKGGEQLKVPSFDEKTRA